MAFIQNYRPHSSSVTAFGGDTFPPGEGITTVLRN